MKQRGRKKNIQLAQPSPISAIDRPEPATELTPEQRLVWIQVVNSLPAEWFDDYSTQSLTQYCRHVIEARRIAGLIEQLLDDAGESIDIVEFTQAYDKLLKLQERESRMIASLMTKMRLTQQSTWSDQKSKSTNRAKVKAPWEG